MTVSQGATSPPAGPDGRPPEPVYAGVEDWVTGQFLPVYKRPLGGEYRWCAQWWQHPEAITRLTALWHAWELLRLQPGTGIASWLRDHLDHHLPVLLGRGGPFAQCSEDEHIDPRQASARLAPAGWWETGGTASPAQPEAAPPDRPLPQAAEDSTPPAGPNGGPRHE